VVLVNAARPADDPSVWKAAVTRHPSSEL